MLFLEELDRKTLKEMTRSGELILDDGKHWMGWSQWQGFNEGIFGIRNQIPRLGCPDLLK